MSKLIKGPKRCTRCGALAVDTGKRWVFNDEVLAVLRCSAGCGQTSSAVVIETKQETDGANCIITGV